MSSSSRRHLDFSGQRGVSARLSESFDDDSPRCEHEMAPQHPLQQNATFSLEGARERFKISPLSPTTSSSRLIRNSRSSHASDMGRRLAQERSKNHELLQQIRELEHTVSSLKEGKHERTIDDRLCFSSPPVTSPTRRGMVDSSEKNDLQSMDYGQGPEEAIRFETERRYTAEDQSWHLSQQSKSNLTKNGDSFVIASDPSIVKLLEKASKLLSGNVIHDNINGNKSDEGLDTTRSKSKYSPQPMNHDGSAEPTRTQERMQEYLELVSAFHAEHESHGDIDGEELISREDILWLFQELKWRFEDILIVYSYERSKKKEDSTAENGEWKECLEGLANVVKKAMRSSPLHQTSNRQDEEHNNESTLANSGHILRNEVSSLQKRLASFAAQHKETCRSLHDDMEAMKRDHQEQLAIKSHRIQNLETKISEQEEYISEIQKGAQKEKQWMQEEKRKLKLSKEGTSARIRYLEGMLRSLQEELKESRTPQGKNGASTSSTPIHDGTLSSPPVFMRDLTSAMQDVNLSQHENNLVDKAHYVQAKYGGSKEDGATSSSELLEQIATLGKSLTESETQRADLLDDFRAERKKYILQYKQMSDMLKLLIDKERIDYT